MIEQWYLTSIQILRQIWGLVEYDDSYFNWVKIIYFYLPSVYFQEYSSLLFITPGLNIDNFSGLSLLCGPGSVAARWCCAAVRARKQRLQ